MAQALETTTVVPWKREGQDVPRILLQVAGHVRRPPTRRSNHRSRGATSDPALIGVYALIEGLRAGQAELARLGWESKATRLAAKAARRQEIKDKATAFVLFWVMSALLVGTMW